MKYSTNEDVQLGDRVALGADSAGVVVGLIATGHYYPHLSPSEWAYLKNGALIEFPTLGMIHYEEIEVDVKFLGRAAKDSDS